MTRLIAMLVAALLWGGPATAQTTEEISARGSINIGVLTELPPFGMLDASQQPAGYDVDVANLLAKYLGVKVAIVPLTGPNRIPFLLTNKVDLIVATFGISPERAKQVMFSIPYSVIQNVVVASRDAKIEKIEDARAYKAGVSRGSTQDVALTGALRGGGSIVRFNDNGATVQALLTGQVDFIVEPTVTAQKLIESNPQLRLEKKFVLASQPNAITMRRGQFDLLQWVNTFVGHIKNSGELDHIHRKWLNEPLPAMPVF